MPPAEVAIDSDLVRGLLRSQAPDLAGLALVPSGAHGWDTAVFRLGEDLAVRLPRRAAAVDLIRNEQRWLPVLAPQLPLPVPEPVLAGSPEPQYPWPWSVCRWVPGDPIGLGDVSSVDPLVRFLEALHRPAPANAPRNAYRGVPLAARDRAMRDGCALLGEHGVAVDPILRAWDELRGAPAFSGAPRWLHGDLHTANVLVRGGRISGVIDFGDLTAGDPACDYLIAWMLPARRARRLRESADRYGRGTWQRARAWALAWGVAALARSGDNAVIHAIGSQVLAAAVPWRPETSTPDSA